MSLLLLVVSHGSHPQDKESDLHQQSCYTNFPYLSVKGLPQHWIYNASLRWVLSLKATNHLTVVLSFILQGAAVAQTRRPIWWEAGLGCGGWSQTFKSKASTSASVAGHRSQGCPIVPHHCLCSQVPPVHPYLHCLLKSHALLVGHRYSVQLHFLLNETCHLVCLLSLSLG